MNDLYYFVIMVFKHKNNNVYNKSCQTTLYKWMHVLTLTHTYTPNVIKDPILNSPHISTCTFYNIGENIYSIYKV